jgi:Holliday junction resolvase RusA-like endonuclease
VELSSDGVPREKMRIEVNQLPPVEWSPNWRGHWAEKHKAGKVYRDAVYYCCVAARNKGLIKGESFPFVKAKVKLCFVFPQQRRRDRDNLLARFKPGLDGLAASGVILDDDEEHLETIDVDLHVDGELAPLTIIELQESRV